MGGWDVNCAICGASFHAYEPFGGEAGDVDEELIYDRAIIAPEDLEWLNNARVIGFNTEAFGVKKCFITGKAEMEDYGQADCDIGDDPNVPRSTGSFPQQNEKVSIDVYCEYELGKPLAFIFHKDCFLLLSKAIYYRQHGNVPSNLGEGESLVGEDDLALGFLSKAALYTAMKRLYKLDSCDHCLGLVDYGELSDLVGEQYWFSRRGDEPWVSNPLASPQIKAFFSQLQDIRRGPLDKSYSTTRTGIRLDTNNPFNKFPKELISEILLSLPLSSLKKFALTGLLPYRLSADQSFWKKKVTIDFPFLYDFPDLEGERDWLLIYQDLYAQCYAVARLRQHVDDGVGRARERDEILVLGLANRRRVWNVCEQITDGYIEALNEMEDIYGGERLVHTAIVKNSLSLQMPIVGNPLSNVVKPISIYFIQSWEALQNILKLKFWFESEDEGGRLCGVEIIDERSCGRKGARGVEVEVPACGWILGLVLTISDGAEDLRWDMKIGITGVEIKLAHGKSIQVGSIKGSKRLFDVNDGMVLTGLIGELGLDSSAVGSPYRNGFITRLGLLQAPDLRKTTLLRPSKIVSQIQKVLWHKQLPPPQVRACTYQTGYWAPNRSYDTIPMSFILFSPDASVEGLERLRGIKSDPNLRCWGVNYVNNEGEGNLEESEKLVGPKDRMDEVKTFKVDGKGGERVVKVEIGMNALVKAVKITTNKQRYAFFGETQKNYHTVYQETETSFLVGLYMSWGYGGDRKEASTVSVLTAAKPGHEKAGRKIDPVTDSEHWSPERPEEYDPLISFQDFIAVVDETEYEAYKERHW